MPNELITPDAASWAEWLASHYGESDGVWLVLIKKGASAPTSLSHAEALEAALAHGWIDGQVAKRDEHTFRQRFSPRRARSIWSKINAETAERLIAEGRMHPNGLAEVERAKADGRWEKAYAGAKTIEMPDDLAAALDASPDAKAMFEVLTSQNRYAIIFRLHAVKRAETRARKLGEFVAMLERGETIHPQKRTRADGPAERGGPAEQGGEN